jgi:hypothetical protein
MGKKSGIQGKFCVQNANRNSSRFHLSLEISPPVQLARPFPLSTLSLVLTSLRLLCVAPVSLTESAFHELPP